MDPSLILTGAMTLLKPLLEKAGKTAAETIGERIGKTTTEKSSWEKIKRLFVVEKAEETIQRIEAKPIATSSDVELIETKLSKAVNSNPDYAAEVQASFGLSSVDMFVAEQLLKSIKADRKQLVSYYEEKRNAGVETEGSYENMIKRTRRRLEKDEKEFLELLIKK